MWLKVFSHRHTPVAAQRRGRLGKRRHLQPHLTRVRSPPTLKWDVQSLQRVLGAERLRRSSASKWLSTCARPLRDAPTALQLSKSSAADTVAPSIVHRRQSPSTWFRNSIVSGTIRAPQQTSRLNRLRSEGGISAKARASQASVRHNYFFPV